MVNAPIPVLMLGADDIAPRCSSISVKHGRTNPREQPDASSLTFELVGPITIPDRAPVSLDLIHDGSTFRRFAGYVSDVRTSYLETTDGWQLAYQVTCVSPLAILGRRLIGDTPWPLDTDTQRAARILSLIGPASVSWDGTSTANLGVGFIGTDPASWPSWSTVIEGKGQLVRLTQAGVPRPNLWPQPLTAADWRGPGTAVPITGGLRVTDAIGWSSYLALFDQPIELDTSYVLSAKVTNNGPTAVPLLWFWAQSGGAQLNRPGVTVQPGATEYVTAAFTTDDASRGTTIRIWLYPTADAAALDITEVSFTSDGNRENGWGWAHVDAMGDPGELIRWTAVARAPAGGPAWVLGGFLDQNVSAAQVIPDSKWRTYQAITRRDASGYTGGLNIYPADFTNVAGHHVDFDSIVALESGTPWEVVGPDGPRVLARDVDRRQALDLLSSVASDAGGLLVQRRNGTISYQSAGYRDLLRPVALDLGPDEVLTAVEHARDTTTIVNSVTVVYGPPRDPQDRAEWSADDPTSVLSGLMQERIDTQLAQLVDAQSMANRVLARYSTLEWDTPALKLDAGPLSSDQLTHLLALDVSDLIRLAAPTAAWPAGSSFWVEGWAEDIEPERYQITLAISARNRFSKGITWAQSPGTWSDVDEATRWIDADDLATALGRT